MILLYYVSPDVIPMIFQVSCPVVHTRVRLEEPYYRENSKLFLMDHILAHIIKTGYYEIPNVSSKYDFLILL